MSAFISSPCITFWSTCGSSAFMSHDKRTTFYIDHARTHDILFCRMRNRGGFRPPPLVPSDPTDLRRAIELLGSLTQRKNMKRSRKQEIERLVGALPESREIAQRWKVALQRGTNRRKEHLAQADAFKNRKRLSELIRLPKDNETVGRCFILLGCVQRRYRLSQPPSRFALDEISRKLGSAPCDEKEVYHYIKTLSFMQKERRSQEMRPPQIPLHNMQELKFVRMLLGTFAVKGSAGKQNMRIERSLGTLPRNSSIAASWKKKIEAAIRRKKRKEKVACRRQEIAQKRLQRRLRRQQRELENKLTLPAYSSPVLLNGQIPRVTPGCKTSPQPSNTSTTEVDPPNRARLFLRVRGLFGRIFRQW